MRNLDFYEFAGYLVPGMFARILIFLSTLGFAGRGYQRLTFRQRFWEYWLYSATALWN